MGECPNRNLGKGSHLSVKPSYFSDTAHKPSKPQEGGTKLVSSSAGESVVGVLTGKKGEILKFLRDTLTVIINHGSKGGKNIFEGGIGDISIPLGEGRNDLA